MSGQSGQITLPAQFHVVEVPERGPENAYVLMVSVMEMTQIYQDVDVGNAHVRDTLLTL